MKTSTKLLIIFLACIPVSLWAYNSLLKKQLEAHNLVMELRPDLSQSYNEEKLPAFKYVVVAGALTFSDGSHKDSSWLPKLNIGDLGHVGHQNTANTISILKQYADIVKHRIVNDTLYISFNKSVKYNTESYPPYLPEIVKVTAIDLHEFNGSSVRVSIDGGIVPARLFKISVSGNSNIVVTGQITDRLDLAVNDSSSADLMANKINDIYYTLPGKGKLTMDVYTANRFHPGKIDSLAWMEIKGKGHDVQQYLK
jgi:archaellum component FlaG (FlaF/FlaG flagellin family)